MLRSASVTPRVPPSKRFGWLATESLIALGILAMIAVFVARLAHESLVERRRALSRQDALEAVVNTLELARARPWNDLTPAWADAQKLPAALAARWPDARLTLRVEPEPERTRVKRVTATINWDGTRPAAERPVSLTAFFAARSMGDAK